MDSSTYARDILWLSPPAPPGIRDSSSDTPLRGAFTTLQDEKSVAGQRNADGLV